MRPKPGVDEVMEKVSIREKRDVPEAGGGGTAREVKEIIVLKKVLERGRWMKQSVAGWRGGASRVGKGLGADGFHLCPLHRLDHTQQANFCPRPTPPTDGGSQETCSGGRMNLAHTLNKSPRVSQDVTLSESREKLGTPFLPCPLPPPPSYSHSLSSRERSEWCLSPVPHLHSRNSAFSEYTRQPPGQSLSAFIDLYHKYTPRQAATQERDPHLTAYTSGNTKQDDCACVC